MRPEQIVCGYSARGFAGFLLLLLLTTTVSAAQDPPEVTEQKIVPDDASTSAHFGSAVAIDSIFAVIGSSDDNTNDVDAGSAYFFEIVDSVWVQVQKFAPGDPSAGAHFGAAISLSGAVAGPVAQEQKINADDGVAGDGFGKSLAVHGDVLVVGSSGHDAAGPDAGAAYVYRYNGSSWSQETKLQAPDAAAGDLFGVSVGLYDNLIAVGASREDSSGTDSGSVYTFRHDGAAWVFEQKLVADDGLQYDLLGTAVDVADSLVIAGAYGNNVGGVNAGSAYIWRYDGLEWLLESRLKASDGARDDHFGFSVALTDSLAVVGSHWDNRGLKNLVGSAYVFQKEISGWIQIHKLTASDGDQIDIFGEAVAVSGYTALIGAPRNDDTANDSGSSYFYAIPRPDPPPPSVAVEDFAGTVPVEFRISSVYPNPFRTRLTIEVELVNPMPVFLTIYNIAGQQVARLEGGYGTAGKNVFIWDARELAAGIYLIRIQSGGVSVTSKVVHIR
jgi:hypothetical protein